MSVLLIFVLVLLLQDNAKAGKEADDICEDYIRTLNKRVEITTSYDVGSIVHKITDADLQSKEEVDEILVDDSQFFILEHDSGQDVWEVKVKQCLPAGLEETLNLILSGDTTTCILYVLRITVSSAGPDYGLDKAINTPIYRVKSCDICSLPAILTPVTDSECVSFYCYVTSATPENIFMVKNGHDVHLVEMPTIFFTEYSLEINCVENVDLITQSHVSVQEVGVVFVNGFSCLSSSQIQTPSTSSSSPVGREHKSTVVKQSTQFSVNVSQISTNKLDQSAPDMKHASHSAEFFSDPAKVSAIVTVTGILILFNSVLGVYFLVCRRICKSQTRRVRDEEIAEENNPT